MFTFRIVDGCDVFGQLYEFPRAGDGIRLHNHEAAADQHITTVLHGACLCYGPDGPERGWSVRLAVCDSYDFPDDRQHHEIVATEPGTLIWSRYKHGRPADLVLSPDDLCGRIDRPIPPQNWRAR